MKNFLKNFLLNLVSLNRKVHEFIIIREESFYEFSKIINLSIDFVFFTSKQLKVLDNYIR